MESRQLVWGDQRKQKLSNFWSMSFQLGSSQNLCLSHKFLSANFFALILEQCSWVGQVLLCTRERENLAAFQGFGSRGPGVFSERFRPEFAFCLKCSTTRIPTKIIGKRKQLGGPGILWRKENAFVSTLLIVEREKRIFGEWKKCKIFAVVAKISTTWGLTCPTKDIWRPR